MSFLAQPLPPEELLEELLCQRGLLKPVLIGDGSKLAEQVELLELLDELLELLLEVLELGCLLEELDDRLDELLNCVPPYSVIRHKSATMIAIHHTRMARIDHPKSPNSRPAAGHATTLEPSESTRDRSPHQHSSEIPTDLAGTMTVRSIERSPELPGRNEFVTIRA